MAVYQRFRADARREMYMRGWRYKDLAKATGLSVATITAVMNGYERHCTDRAVNLISKVLEIEV